MNGHIILASRKREDVDFFAEVAGHAGMDFVQTGGPDVLRRDLPDHSKKSVLIVDIEQTVDLPHYSALAGKYLQPRQVIAVSSAGHQPHQKLMSRFGHHWTRRTQMPAALLCTKLVQAAANRDPFGIVAFFPKGAPFASIAIRRSSQKAAVLNAVHGHLTRVGVRGRLASLVAQSTDELLMNAIFDSPLSKLGFRSLHERPRELDIQLHSSEYVHLKVATSSSYMAISVSDQFGSLDRTSLHQHMFSVNREQKQSMGLKAIYQSGVTLLATIHPKVATEMTLIFPRVDNYRDFRSGPRFFSALNI